MVWDAPSLDSCAVYVDLYIYIVNKLLIELTPLRIDHNALQDSTPYPSKPLNAFSFLLLISGQANPDSSTSTELLHPQIGQSHYPRRNSSVVNHGKHRGVTNDHLNDIQV